MNTYFGKNLGNTGYVRNREAEFVDKTIPKEIFLKSIEEVGKVLENLIDEQVKAIYSENVLGYEMTTEYFLIHLHGHLTYHTGQINYHRQFVNRIFWFEIIIIVFIRIGRFDLHSNSVLPTSKVLPFSRQRHFPLGQE